MLVIMSDLHLTDGTSGQTINSSAFRIFRQRLCDLAYDASWRKDGTYQPIESLDVILLGDILDVIRSTRWLRNSDDETHPTRPWSDPHSLPFINRIRTITETILKHNTDSLTVLQQLNNGQTITIPPPDKNGKPAKVDWNPASPGRVPVQVKIHYMVGNHDWFYHLPGKEYDAIRQQIITAMGLTQDANDIFAHDPTESSVLTEVMQQHRVLARHGDVFDSFNFSQNRNMSSLGDAIVVELLNYFPVAVTEQIGYKLPKPFSDGLKELDNVRPNIIVPLWIDSLLRQTCANQPQLIRQVHGIWNDLVNGFLQIDFVQQHNSYNPIDNINILESVLKFSQGFSFQSLSEIVKKVMNWVGSNNNSYSRNVLQEEAFKNRHAQFFVYGHTHYGEFVPLDAAEINEQILNRMYFNTGTWRRIHELGQFNKNKTEVFIGHQVMTYLTFFKDNEHRGRPFEYWSGSLGGE